MVLVPIAERFEFFSCALQKFFHLSYDNTFAEKFYGYVARHSGHKASEDSIPCQSLVFAVGSLIKGAAGARATALFHLFSDGKDDMSKVLFPLQHCGYRPTSSNPNS